MRKSIGIPTYGFVARANLTDNAFVNVYFRVTFAGKSSERAVYSRCPAKGWGKEKQQFTKHCEGWFGLNEMLKSYTARANDYIIKTERSGDLYSFDNFFKAVFPNRYPKEAELSFFDIMDKYANEMAAEKKMSRKRLSRAVKSSLMEFSIKISVDDFNEDFIERYRVFLNERDIKVSAKKMTESTIRTYLHHMKSACNRAVKKNWVREGFNPFKNIIIGGKLKSTKERARTIDEIKAVLKVELPTKSLRFLRRTACNNFWRGQLSWALYPCAILDGSLFCNCKA